MLSAINKRIRPFLVVVILSFIGINSAIAQQSGPVVKTSKGYIRGVIENGISVFKGIPYAAPPIGSLRFMPPVEHAAWHDTLSATKFGAIATQPSGVNIKGSEDCLLLNLYTPNADNKKRAVLVWVHGGSMTAGAGMSQDGHAFADNDDIVTITINYRLGALGFLYLGDVDKRYAGSGNCGLLDVVSALKWIKQNISKFGGDPERITLMGESAGAKLISAVLVSPESKGLFRQYIAESGSVQCIRDTNTAKNERLRILNQLGLGANDARKLLTIPADSIIKAQGIVCAGIGGNSFFGPVDDGVAITQDAYQYAAGKDLPRIKALIGTNKEEAAAFIAGESRLKKPDTAVLKELFADNYPMVYRTFNNQLKTDTTKNTAIRVITLYMYQMHSYRFAKALVQNKIPVWMFRFDYEKASPIGAAHATELQFVWNEPKLRSAKAEKQLMIKNMHGAWVAFIKTGNPNIAGLPPWPDYNNTKRPVMIFDTNDHVTELKDVFDDKDFPSAVFVLKN